MEYFKMAKVNFKNSFRKSSLYSIVHAERQFYQNCIKMSTQHFQCHLVVKGTPDEYFLEIL